MPFAPAPFPTPTIMKFSEDQIQDICRFALRNEYETKEDLNKILKDILQETRHLAAYPPHNVFGDELCGDCRIRYHRPEYHHCLTCDTLQRTQALNQALDPKDSLESWCV